MSLADEHRGSRHARGYSDLWAKYSRQFRLEHPLCADPYHVHGELGAFTEVTDHVVPPWAGGGFWDPSNHQPLCQDCNKRKAADDRRRFAMHRNRGGVENFGDGACVPACGINAQNGKTGALGGVVP